MKKKHVKMALMVTGHEKLRSLVNSCISSSKHKVTSPLQPLNDYSKHLQLTHVHRMSTLCSHLGQQNNQTLFSFFLYLPIFVCLTRIHGMSKENCIPCEDLQIIGRDVGLRIDYDRESMDKRSPKAEKDTTNE